MGGAALDRGRRSGLVRGAAQAYGGIESVCAAWPIRWSPAATLRLARPAG